VRQIGPDPVVAAAPSDHEARIAALEEQVGALRTELRALREDLGA